MALPHSSNPTTVTPPPRTGLSNPPQPPPHLLLHPPPQSSRPPHHHHHPIYHHHVTTTTTTPYPPRATSSPIYPPSRAGPQPYRPSRAHPQPMMTMGLGPPYSHSSLPNRPFGFSHSDHPAQAHLTRPAQHHHHQNHSHSVTSSGANAPPIVVRGIPVSSPPPAYQKVVLSPTTAPEGNGYKDPRSKDDNFVTVRDRKVRISDSTSLYAACRSWLRNGFPIEKQPQYMDGVRVLPKPSPPPVPDAHSPAKQEPNIKEEEEEEKEEEGSVENLSPSNLLQRHVKRAKKVRARLREERLQRIARYKTRLALLLPPLGDQHHQFRNEAAAGN